MFSGINMNRLVGGSKANAAAASKGGKRKAEVSPRKMDPAIKKRSALGDLTNAVKKKSGLQGGKDKGEKTEKLEKVSVKQEIPAVVTRSRTKSIVIAEEPEELTQPLEPKKENKKSEKVAAIDLKVKVEDKSQHAQSKLPVRQTRSSKSRDTEDTKDETDNKPAQEQRMATRRSAAAAAVANNGQDTEEEEDSCLYTTAVSSPTADMMNHDVQVQNRKNEELSLKQKSKLPDGVIDFDADTGNDPFQVGLYAEDIFAYYRRRETRFPVRKYLDKQSELNRNMRSILVDWMVEVQESFELNHETMYLGVKIVDLFLSKVQVKREQLQLVGTTALYISAKYDERAPPVIDDFCYICDDAYPQKEVIKMEMKILKALNYDIGCPLSYRFLRRFSRCARLDMDTLTLSRYVLEMSLMEYDFIDVKDSMIAASCLLLALVMKGVKNPWSKTLEYYSGYAKEELFDLTHRLHAFLVNVPVHLKTIRSKYSHKVFYESAKVPIPEELQL